MRRPRDASDQHAGEAGAAVRAEHDEACVVLVGDLDDALPGGRGLGRRGTGLEPRASASEAPSAAVCSAARSTSATCAASNCTPPAGRKPTSNGSQTVRTSASRPGSAGGRPRRSRLRQVRPVVGEYDRAAEPCCVLSSWLCGLLGERAVAARLRTAASSGGEYQAGPSPSMNRSRSGVCGRAPPST